MNTNDVGQPLHLTVVSVGLSNPSSTRLLVTGFPLPALTQAIEAVSSADGMIAVTPIFTGSYSGLFKSFLDTIDDGALTRKAVWPLRQAPMAIDRVSPSTCPLPRPAPPAA